MNQPGEIQMQMGALIKCPDEYCECGCPYFKQRYIIKRIPGLMAGVTTDQYSPLPFWACEKCAKPHRSTFFEVPVMKKIEA